MLCGLTLPGLPTRKAKRATLASGIRVCECPIFPSNIDEAPWHRRHHGREILDACVTRVRGAMVPSVLTLAKWNTMCGRLVVCLVGHPFEWQDRDSADVPICLAGITNPIVRKLPTCDRHGEPLPVWNHFCRMLVKGCFQAANVTPTDAQIEAIREQILGGLKADVKAAQDAQDLHDYMIEWCNRNCTVPAVTDWLAANPPPPEWTGYTVDVGPPGGPSSVLPMGWAFENRAVFENPAP
jgi:hypothetical protein